MFEFSDQKEFRQQEPSPLFDPFNKSDESIDSIPEVVEQHKLPLICGEDTNRTLIELSKKVDTVIDQQTTLIEQQTTLIEQQKVLNQTVQKLLKHLEPLN